MTTRRRLRGPHLHRLRRGAGAARAARRRARQLVADVPAARHRAVRRRASTGRLRARLNVEETLPRWSGDMLDLVVDFITYVFVPAYAVVATRAAAGPLASPRGSPIVITGALYFADREHEDRTTIISAAFRRCGICRRSICCCCGRRLDLPRPAIALLAVLTFVPVPFVHPFRVRRLRALTLRCSPLWAVLGAASPCCAT